MALIPLLGAAAGGGGTYYAIRNTKLPMIAKVGVSLIGAGVGYAATKKISSLVMPSNAKDAVALATTAQSEVLKNNALLPADQQIKYSYTKDQYKTYANKLETAMKGLGTDDEAITDVMGYINNDLDYLALVEAFGVRDDDDLAAWLEGDGATEEANAVLATKANVSKRF